MGRAGGKKGRKKRWGGEEEAEQSAHPDGRTQKVPVTWRDPTSLNLSWVTKLLLMPVERWEGPANYFCLPPPPVIALSRTHWNGSAYSIRIA